MAKLYFRYGVMNSGKTLDLIKVYFNYKELNYNTLILKPIIDTKGAETIITRSGERVVVDFLIDENDNIYNLLKDIIGKNNIKCILVDEVQFLKIHHIDELSDIVDDFKVPIICYGLRADNNTNLFDGSKRLFEVADSIEEIKTICECGVKATHNLRFINKKPVFGGPVVAIDGSQNVTYKSFCRKCYKKYKRESENK